MKLKNLLFQPLTLHLSVDNEGIHLNARECKEIIEERISAEIQLAAARGLVSILDKVDKGVSHVSEAEATPAAEPAPKKGARK